jgi:hypothetical protein
MFSRCLALSLYLTVLSFVTGRADDAIIPAEDAAKHVGEFSTVEFVVKSSRQENSKQQGMLLFLNSATSVHAPENVAMVIDNATAGKFAGGMPAVKAYYLHKQIRVTGIIQASSTGGSEMRVSDPSQVQIVDANPPPDPRDIPPPPPEPPSDSFDPTPPSYTPYWVGSLLVGGGLLLTVGLVVRKRRKKKEIE